MAGRPAAARWPVRARRGVSAAAPLVLVGLLVWKWAAVEAGTDAMGRADREWLLVSGAAVLLTWVAASCCQIGATTAPLPVGRVFATQVAGSFVNHVLPAGFGVATLNLRMLRRAGLTLPSAAGAVGLNAAAGFVVHAIALGALLVALGPRADRLDPVGLAVSTGAIGLALAVAAVSARRSLRRGGWLARHLQPVLAAGRAVLRHPVRSAMLWAGSAAVPALHILTLTAVLRALHQPVPVVLLAAIYLSASAVAAAIPGPGGFGALDVALLAALTGAGTTAATAGAAVIGYRLITVWLPLLPGAATLLLLLHRRVI